MAAVRPTSSMPLTKFNAVTMRNWTTKRLKFRLRLQLTINKVVQKTNLTVAQRVKIAAQMLRDAIVVNLSRPVRKFRGPKSKRTQVDRHSRSKPGEFPRADTSRLLRSIFHTHYPAQILSRVGTNLAYGVLLEMRMDRSFLRRTLRELRREILLLIQHGSIGGI